MASWITGATAPPEPLRHAAAGGEGSGVVADRHELRHRGAGAAHALGAGGGAHRAVAGPHRHQGGALDPPRGQGEGRAPTPKPQAGAVIGAASSGLAAGALPRSSARSAGIRLIQHGHAGPVALVGHGVLVGAGSGSAGACAMRGRPGPASVLAADGAALTGGGRRGGGGLGRLDELPGRRRGWRRAWSSSWCRSSACSRRVARRRLGDRRRRCGVGRRRGRSAGRRCGVGRSRLGGGGVGPAGRRCGVGPAGRRLLRGVGGRRARGLRGGRARGVSGPGLADGERAYRREEKAQRPR